MSYLEELLPEFRKGAKIRQTYWDNSEYICLKDEKIIDENGVYFTRFYDSWLISDVWEFYQEPEPDWNYIIKNKCLCWFWCEHEEEKKVAGLLAEYDSYNSQFGRYKGKNVAVTYFDHCCPIHRDEVTFYEDREDD